CGAGHGYFSRPHIDQTAAGGSVAWRPPPCQIALIRRAAAKLGAFGGPAACVAAGSGLSRWLQPRSSLRLAAQDVALSRRKQGFESPRERQTIQSLNRVAAAHLTIHLPMI